MQTSFVHHEGLMMTKTIGRWFPLLTLFSDIPMNRNVYLQQYGAQCEAMAFLAHESHLRTPEETRISSTTPPHVHLPLPLQADRRSGLQHKPVLLDFLLSTMFLLHGRERR
jgi:hypothetical protein